MFKIAAVSRRDTRTSLLPLWSSRAMVRYIRLRGCHGHVRASVSAEREEDVARSDYQGHCLCFIRPLSIARGATALNFHDVRSNVGTHRWYASALRRCASCDATTLLRSVRGIRDVFMSKREREGDLEPSMPSPALPTLLSTDPRETGCFPLPATSFLPSSNTFEFIQTLHCLQFVICPG